MSDRVVMIPPYRVMSKVSILAETVDFNHRLMNVPAMWKKTKGGVREGELRLVILDTGVPSHIDLKPSGGKSFIEGYQEDLNGHGCVAPDTLVHTNFCGIETIEKLYSRVEAPEQGWQSPDGSTGVVKDVRSMGIKTFSFDVDGGKTVIGDIEFLHKTPVAGSVVAIGIKGSGEMTLTPWHPVPVQRRNAHGDKYYEKVRADQLVEGDLLIVPSTDKWVSEKMFSFDGATKWGCEKCGHSHVHKRDHIENSEHRCSKCGERHSMRSFVPSYIVTENLAYLMGLIFTDGSITKTSKGVTVTVASKDHELTDIASRISEGAGFGAGTYYDRDSVRVWRNHGKDFFTFLCNSGFEVGKKKNSSIPQFFGKSTRNVACAFVAGLIDGDGCVAPKKGVSSNILVSSRNVAEKLRVLLNCIGVRTSISIAVGTTFGSENKRRTGRDQFCCKFTSIVPEVVSRMAHPSRLKRAEKLSPLYKRGVCNIGSVRQDAYEGHFYDFTVRDTHTYLANGIFMSNTHCGGVIAGISGNNMGVAGIAPDVSDYYGAVLGHDGGGEIGNIVKGIMWAVDDVGAKIISMSLGIPAGYPNFEALEKACNYAREQGVLIIAAAGNEAGDVGQPACFDSVTAIAAVNNKKERAWFSNTGPEVDFAAGGVDVYSTYLNNGYAKLSGTSMACPAMSAMFALIIADEKNDHNRWLSPDEAVEKMKKISFDVGADGFDEQFGHGIPVFSNIEEPDEPGDQPNPIPIPEPSPPSGKKSSFPCGMTWSLLSTFGDAAGKAAKAGATPDGAILAGFKSIGRLAEKLETTSEG